jgi:hypothetical protein
VNFGNFGYIWTEGTIGSSSGTGLTFVDPQAWYYWHTGKQYIWNHLNQYVNSGINGGGTPYGNFSSWTGQYEGRYYNFVKNTSRLDTIPPAKITDLKAIINGSDVTLTWTAPPGTDLQRYHIVWATKPIAETTTTNTAFTNWWAANAIGPLLVPVGGTQQSITLAGIATSPFYAAIFTFDNQDNMSPMSNLALAGGTP